jgi:hypothetical protein
VSPLQIEPLTIAIDIFSLVYTYRINLTELLEFIRQWSDNGHTIICVWDGVAPKEKRDIINERRSARESATDKKNGLESYLEEYGAQLSEGDKTQLNTAISSLSWQGWHLTGALKREIQEKLGPKVEHIFAAGEADDLLLEMAFSENKKVDVILTLDSDIFAMGAPHLWRLLRVRNDWIVEDVYIEDVCNSWGISLSILQDASFLAGWDRCLLKGESYMMFSTALTRMKHYGVLDTVIEKFIVNGVDKEAYDRLLSIKSESKTKWIQLLKTRELTNPCTDEPLSSHD